MMDLRQWIACLALACSVAPVHAQFPPDSPEGLTQVGRFDEALVLFEKVPPESSCTVTPFDNTFDSNTVNRSQVGRSNPLSWNAHYGQGLCHYSLNRYEQANPSLLDCQCTLRGAHR